MVLKSNDKVKAGRKFARPPRKTAKIWQTGVDMIEKTERDAAENFEEMLAMHEACAPKLQSGQKVSGKIIAITGDGVFVDLGVKQDGVMDRAEILDADGNEKVAVGDAISAYIVNLSSQGIRLSRSMIGAGFAALEEARDAGVPVEGRVKRVCKGGYEVETLGKTAFCPGSQMENTDDPQSIVGKQMQFLITRIENRGRNIVVSHRALVERERKENLDKFLTSININDTVDGKISRLVPYGAFVELTPGVEGLVHISELSWSRVSSPDEAVSLDDPVRVKVMGIAKDDKGQTRIGLSIKQAQGDPWENIGGKFEPGAVVEGIVRRIAPFGAFLEIAPGIEGLAHISELSWERRIAKPEDVLAVGDKIPVKIREIDQETRRVSLSVKDAQGDPWQEAVDKFAPGAKVKGIVESRTPHGLFVRLAPGISGLLPQGALNADKSLAKVGPDDEIEIVVASVDPASRRVSLRPVASGDMDETEEKNWKQHQALARPDGKNLGIMAAAMKRAFEKRKGK